MQRALPRRCGHHEQYWQREHEHEAETGNEVLAEIQILRTLYISTPAITKFLWIENKRNKCGGEVLHICDGTWTA